MKYSAQGHASKLTTLTCQKRFQFHLAVLPSLLLVCLNMLGDLTLIHVSWFHQIKIVNIPNLNKMHVLKAAQSNRLPNANAVLLCQDVLMF